MTSNIKSKYFSNRSILPKNGSLTGTTTPGQSESRSNDNERALYQSPQLESYLGRMSPMSMNNQRITLGSVFGTVS